MNLQVPASKPQEGHLARTLLITLKKGCLHLAHLVHDDLADLHLQVGGRVAHDLLMHRQVQGS